GRRGRPDQPRGGRALRRLARRVRGRTAAPFEPPVVPPTGRRHAAQCCRKRTSADRALCAEADFRRTAWRAVAGPPRSNAGVLTGYAAAESANWRRLVRTRNTSG